MNIPLPESARQELLAAKTMLDHTSLAARMAQAAGMPVEKLLKRLPKFIRKRIDRAVEDALQRTMEVAVSSLGNELPYHLATTQEPEVRRHRVMATGAGTIGGAFGLPGLLVELPFTTTLILRMIADIARTNGEDLRNPEARLACVEVFAYGAPGTHDDAIDTGYLAVRHALSASFSAAAGRIAASGLSGSAPVISTLVQAIAARFTTAVSHKVAAQMVPLAGAVGGATINALFIEHYRRIAEGHFTVRRLERQYGREIVDTGLQTR